MEDRPSFETGPVRSGQAELREGLGKRGHAGKGACLATEGGQDKHPPIAGQALYHRKVAARNFRGGDGKVSINRSPVGVIALPDR